MENENKKGRRKKEIGYNSVFATRLRKLMEENKTTQPQLAEAVGVSRQAVGQWKDGNTVPDILDFQKIADYYNVPADYLLGRSKNSMTENEIKEKQLYKYLSDEAIKNIEMILKIDMQTVAPDGIIINLPFSETCNDFFSSTLFFELIRVFAETSAYSKWQLEYCGFSMEKSELTCKALNISYLTLLERLVKLIDKDFVDFTISGKPKDIEEIAKYRIMYSNVCDNKCGLARYKAISIVERINDFFDNRNIITDTISEKERFLKLINISELELEKIENEVKEIIKLRYQENWAKAGD